MTAALAVLPDLVSTQDAPRIVFVDGHVDGDLSDIAGLPAGVSCHSERAEGAGASEVAVIRVATDAGVGEATIGVVHLTTGEGQRSRTVVDLEPGARLTLTERFAGTGPVSVTDATTELSLGAGARLTHHRLVTGPSGAAHVGHTAATVDEGAELRSWSLLAGIGSARATVDVVLRGDRALARLEGLDLAVGEEDHDTAVSVEHAASHGTSRQHFKGVAGGRARTSFGGRVLVPAGTVGNDAGQITRGLLLQPTARADARPWLEIFADDVRCSHGATVGRLDEDALFFLRSRGIPRDHARRMLVGAFAAEVLEAIELPDLRAFVEATIAEVLAGEGAP